MSTTTIRVDTDTHAQLAELAKTSNTSLLQTVSAAAEALRRQRFAEDVTSRLAEMRADDHIWSQYLHDAETTSVSDGLN
ncbi:MAG: hypothetical protein GXP35_15480 [Actinobacteria bacterium]|nr:hypothetical protein [Actinomycetota bacterium]